MEQNWCGGDNDNRDVEVLFSTIHVHNECEIPVPEGYQLVDAQGNIIDTPRVMVLKKKKAYPKTYEECLKILGFTTIYTPKVETMFDYDDDIIALQKLKNCRNAYWKIAGQEMGLGKPWEPDWGYDSPPKYIISCHSGVIIKAEYCGQYNKPLSFPTPEMQDAFYEAFKKEIEICKELL